MTDHTTVVPIDKSEAQARAAIEAEERLFAHYGLEYQVHHIDIKEPSMQVRALEVGSGAPVLMVPGGNGIAVELVPLMAELQGWRMIAVNLPGGGLSDAVDYRQVDYRGMAVDVLTRVLDVFELECLPTIANSIGGLWTLWLALATPDRISRMVQVGCPAFLYGQTPPLPMRLLSVPLVNRLLFPMAQPGSPEGVSTMLRMLLGSSREMTQALPDVVPEAFHRMFHLSTYRLSVLSFLETVLTVRGPRKQYHLDSSDLSRIEPPVLFIWGANDTFGAVKLGERAVQAMSQARLEVVDGGHVPYLDSPGACARLIDDFMSQAGE